MNKETKKLFRKLMDDRAVALGLGITKTNWTSIRYKLKEGIHISEAYMEGILIKAGYQKQVNWVPPQK